MAELMNLEEFLAKFKDVQREPNCFSYYSEIGDFFCVILSDQQYFAHRLDADTTLYLSMVNREVVGFKMHNFKTRTQGAVEALNKALKCTTGSDADEK